MMLRFQKITMWFLDSFFLRSNDVNKLPDSRNTFDMCRTNGTEPTSLRGAEWNKRVEEENVGVERAEGKEVAMEGVEVVDERVVEEKMGEEKVVEEKLLEEEVVEEPSKMVRWGSSADSTHLEHC